MSPPGARFTAGIQGLPVARGLPQGYKVYLLSEVYRRDTRFTCCARFTAGIQGLPVERGLPQGYKVYLLSEVYRRDTRFTC